MMMAAMKAKQGILNSGNILDIVCEGAEVGASLPGDAGFPENVEFSVEESFQRISSLEGASQGETWTCSWESLTSWGQAARKVGHCFE